MVEYWSCVNFVLYPVKCVAHIRGAKSYILTSVDQVQNRNLEC